MSSPELIVHEDGLTNKWSNDEWQRLSVFPGENPNPTFNFSEDLQNQLTASPVLSRPSVKDESFRMVLPVAMSPPRDKAVPLPVFPELMMKPRKKLGQQEAMTSVGKSRCHEKNRNHDEEEDSKCNAFCISLPGFGKQKPIKSPKSHDSYVKKKMIKASSFPNSKVSMINPGFLTGVLNF